MCVTVGKDMGQLIYACDRVYGNKTFGVCNIESPIDPNIAITQLRFHWLSLFTWSLYHCNILTSELRFSSGMLEMNLDSYVAVTL